ncbi:MAG: hypothetical protein IJI22_04305 [Bacilli bacterium]|nr:hypothetical protein [Bacilli bacterium]
MYDNYLIPANTKRGQLLLGMFRLFDLLLFGGGVLVTLLLVAFLPMTSTFVTILVVSPAIITGFLVMPVPYYHNMLNIIVEIYEFFFVNPREYEWKGWCYRGGKRK